MKSRKIKFRVWNNHYKEYVKPSDGCSDYSFIQYKNGDFSLFGVSAECLIIQQYTGIKDKNGKEIYEGDKLKCSGGKFKKKYDEFTKEEMVAEGIVIFYKGCFWCVDFPLFDYNELEIIDNIFENPELVK